MKSPLRILLPVYNAQHALSVAVADALEVIGEGAERFELIVVDDGSTDVTTEIVPELTACWPQLRVIRHAHRLGLIAGVRAVLERTGGQFVLLGRDCYQYDPRDLRALWRLREVDRALGDTSRWTALAQIGFQVIPRAAFDVSRLDHALDSIARIDSRGSSAEFSTRPTPNFLGRLKKLALGE